MGEKMKTKSDVTNLWYENEDVVFFRNLYQSAFYVEHNATIVDVFTDRNGKLVFVFYKSEHEELIKLWMKNKTQDNNE